jgi:hypothetical protein
MVSVVNGYMCYSSCQAAAARAGKDPHAPPGAPAGQHGGKDKANGLAGQQPSILDPGHASNAINASNGPNAVDPAAAAGAANADYQSSSGVNLLI